MAKKELRDIPGKILAEISKVVIGKGDIKELLLVALLSGGHVLIEGLTGTAKTLLAKSFAQAIGGEFKRIQFTPDMLPSDITGYYFYTPDGSSRFIKGPIFANILLTDELNRATPRTQSALLEAMQENQVTIEGRTHPVPLPFMTIASQLPYGAEGTYPLTEVQHDRFMFRIWSGYPGVEEEIEVIGKIDLIESRLIEPVATLEDIEQLKEMVKGVFVSDHIKEYIVSLVNQVRRESDILIGLSPRASISLYKGARALAFLDGRGFVIPDDVKKLAPLVMEHRTKLKPEAEMEGLTPGSVVQRALEAIPVPR